MCADGVFEISKKQRKVQARRKRRAAAMQIEVPLGNVFKATHGGDEEQDVIACDTWAAALGLPAYEGGSSRLLSMSAGPRDVWADNSEPSPETMAASPWIDDDIFCYMADLGAMMPSNSCGLHEFEAASTPGCDQGYGDIHNHDFHGLHALVNSYSLPHVNDQD
jgi:hypothetical protein